MTFFRRKKFEREMDEELRFHIEARVDDLVRSGVNRAEAQHRARIEFGGIESTKDECRQSWGLQRIDELRQDVRLTFRTIRQSPGFAAIAILSLAFGIGANTAIFALVDAVMLRILPVHDPGKLVFIQNVGTEGQNGGPPYPCFELLRDHTSSFEGMAAFSPSNMEIVIDKAREQVNGLWLSGDFYNLLAVRPIVGRTLSAADDQTVGKGGPDGPVVVISQAYWQRRFGGDRTVVGRRVHMFENIVTIVGVMPDQGMSLTPGATVDIAAPMMLSSPDMLLERASWWFDVVARLKPGVQPERARAEADTLFQAFMADVHIPQEMRKQHVDHIELAPAAKGMDRLRVRFARPLMALMILVGLVLLAACANTANLMLARATARQKEFAVRVAIGAGRWRLIRQTLTEALILSGTGCLLGLLIARQGEAALAAYFAEGNSKIILDLSLNGRVLLFTLGVSLLTGLAFGLLPAFRAARVDPAAGLQSGSRSFAGTRRGLRLGRMLVMLQVALSTVLLAGAGLFIHSLRQLESVDLGFTREGILTMEVAPEHELYGKPQWFVLQREILDRVSRLPRAQSASWSSMSPMDGHNRGVIVAIASFTPRSENDKQVRLLSASPEYFATFGIPVLQGRTFTPHDDQGAPRVMMLNETAARFYFGAASPVGRIVTFPRRREGDTQYEIVGVIKDTKHNSLRGEPERFVYLPLPQSIDRINRLALAVRTSGDPMAFASAVRKEVLGVHSNLLITNISTIDKQVELSLIKERLVSTLSTAFGALALLLVSIGLYGILAYAVAMRTSEIGIRMALGATQAGILWSVLREALTLAACGIAIGIPAVLALARIAKALLFGVETFDLPVYTLAVTVLLIFAGIAAFVPARRASALDPMSALRCE
jgi:predicted permease